LFSGTLLPSRGIHLKLCSGFFAGLGILFSRLHKQRRKGTFGDHLRAGLDPGTRSLLPSPDLY